MATTCNNFAAFLYSKNRMKEAETYYKEALKNYRRLAIANPDTFKANVAMTCNNFAVLLKDTNRMEEAEAYYKEALENYRCLSLSNPAAFEPYVAITCNNLAILLSDTDRMEEAEAYYREALERYRCLSLSKKLYSKAETGYPPVRKRRKNTGISAEKRTAKRLKTTVDTASKMSRQAIPGQKA